MVLIVNYCAIWLGKDSVDIVEIFSDQDTTSVINMTPEECNRLVTLEVGASMKFANEPGLEAIRTSEVIVKLYDLRHVFSYDWTSFQSIITEELNSATDEIKSGLIKRGAI